MQVAVGQVLEGKISGITNFGAFVELPGGGTGLVHISEVAVRYVKDINEHLKTNEIVKVKVLSIDNAGKVSLSIKKVIEEEQGIKSAPKPAKTGRYGKPPVFNGGFGAGKPVGEASFEDLMSKFKQDSDERMSDIKRNMESKRGGYKKMAHL